MAILLPPAEGSIASWRDLRQHCVPGCFSGHCDLGRSCPALRLMFYSSITSWRSQPCVRRCSSAPCVPPKGALRLISAVGIFSRLLMSEANSRCSFPALTNSTNTVVISSLGHRAPIARRRSRLFAELQVQVQGSS